MTATDGHLSFDARRLRIEMERQNPARVTVADTAALIGRYMDLIRHDRAAFHWRRMMVDTALNMLALQMPAEALATILVGTVTPLRGGGTAPTMAALDDRLGALIQSPARESIR